MNARNKPIFTALDILATTKLSSQPDGVARDALLAYLTAPGLMPPQAAPSLGLPSFLRPSTTQAKQPCRHSQLSQGGKCSPENTSKMAETAHKPP